MRSEQRRFIRRNGSPFTVRARVMRLATHPGGLRYVRLARCGKCVTVWPHVVMREVFGDKEHAA